MLLKGPCPWTQQSLGDFSKETTGDEDHTSGTKVFIVVPYYYKSRNSFSLQQRVIIAWIVDPMEPIKDYVCQRSLVILENVYNIMSPIL